MEKLHDSLRSKNNDHLISMFCYKLGHPHVYMLDTKQKNLDDGKTFTCFFGLPLSQFIIIEDLIQHNRTVMMVRCFEPSSQSLGRRHEAYVPVIFPGHLHFSLILLSARHQNIIKWKTPNSQNLANFSKTNRRKQKNSKLTLSQDTLGQ